jgi:gliding motility-associated-like protein
MKNLIVLSFLTLLVTGYSTRAQTINIHSVSTLREISFDNGYTLDGDHMAASRVKLFNPANFSDTGLYKKNITIQSAYFTSGSLEQITQIHGIDIFFFGSFYGSATEFIPFTQGEIDSLYVWSLRGGKLIIAEQNLSGAAYPMVHLGQKWGYNIMWLSTSGIIPVEKAKRTKIFNGPFGLVDRANMGGSAQGYFSGTGPDISVLATNSAGKNTLYIDCKTRDLICPDVDVYTDLGGLSNGDEIVNEQDRFWANTIAFMDSLGDAPPPAVIQYDGTSLYTDTYYSYQWLLNWDIIEGADTSAIVPDAEGYYQVIVEDIVGCTDTSELFVYGTPLLPLIHCPEDITTATDEGVNYATLTLPLPRALDPDGIASYTNDAPDKFPMGNTVVTWTVTDSAGYSSGCSHTITVVDKEKPSITCPPKIDKGTDPGRNYATLSLDTPVTNDNVFVYSLTNDAPETYPIGYTKVKWIVSDSSGNTSNCSQGVTITDTESPTINCPPDISDTIEAGQGNTFVNLGQPVTSDNDKVVSVSNNAPVLFPLGSTTVTWTARDEADNSTSCDQQVKVSETVPDPEAGLIFHNIITPNGDGRNEFFLIENLQEHSELIIFDRFNNVLYKTDNYQNDWNGVDSQNTPLESGTYWYIVNTLSGKQYSGYIIVKRE